MDFKLTPAEEKFKEEVREFLKGEAELSSEAKKEMEAGLGHGPGTWAILRKVGAKGWLCPTWPKKYGGLELPHMHRYIISEEMAAHLGMVGGVGAGMAGPVILRHGSEEQKEKYLRPIARGEIEFTLGYTEPDAGSDLASLIISAEDKGDHFIINGQKMFNTRCHYTHYHWLMARTQETKPGHKGISLFIVDLKSPGISLTPYFTVGGTRTNGVFYDNVKVPRECLVGEVNKGFYYVIEALAYERVVTISALERLFTEFLDYLNEHGLGKDPLVRQEAAEIAIEVEAAKLLALKVAWLIDNRKIPYHEAPMMKIMHSETEQRLVNTALQIMGPYGQLKKGTKWAQADGSFEYHYRESLETLIVRGTSEIMRTIIAERGLGLPRV